MFTDKTTYLPNHNPDIRYQNLLFRKFPEYDKIINFIKEETKYCARLKKILEQFYKLLCSNGILCLLYKKF